MSGVDPFATKVLDKEVHARMHAHTHERTRAHATPLDRGGPETYQDFPTSIDDLTRSAMIAGLSVGRHGGLPPRA